MNDEMKTCRLCSIAQPVTEYHKHPSTRDRRAHECKTCIKGRRRAWYAANSEKALAYSLAWKHRNPERWRDAMRKSRHGIAYGTYERLLSEQGGGCAICGAAPPDGISLHVDHDHVTGRIRSLLCDLCNRGLGYFSDDPHRLETAAAYLRWHDRPRRGGDAA